MEKYDKRYGIKKFWAASINLSGLYSSYPIRVVFDRESEKWWDKEGNFDISGPGLINSKSCRYISFADPNKKIVQAWIDGVKSTMRILKEFSWVLGQE